MKTKTVVTEGVYQGNIAGLRGMKLRLRRRSLVTGYLTCQVLEDFPPYKQWQEIHIAPYEFGCVVTYRK